VTKLLPCCHTHRTTGSTGMEHSLVSHSQYDSFARSPARRLCFAVLLITAFGLSACGGDPLYIDFTAPAKAAPGRAECGGKACEPSKPYCDTLQGVCVECLEGGEGCTKRDRLVCDVSVGTCVECLVDGDCSPTRPHCQTATQECVECLAKADCEDPTRTCHPATFRCVPTCSSNAECGAATPICSESFQICVQCAVSKDCTDPKKAVCKTEEGRCVQCTEDQHCEGGSTCDPRDGQCRAAPAGPDAAPASSNPSDGTGRTPTPGP
jgi:hypothetical protein